MTTELHPDLAFVARSLMGEPTRNSHLVNATGLAEFASRHGVAPLLESRFRSQGHSSLNELRAHLAAEALATAAANLRLLAELKGVRKFLGQRAIESVPFKGLTLSARLYGDISLRPCSDLDLLVAKSQFEEALHCLRRFGYQQKPEGSSRRERYVRDTSYKVTLARSASGPFLDLHWAAGMPQLKLAPTFEEMRARLVQVQAGGIALPALRNEDLLVSLVVHGTRHHWQRLLWLCDVTTLSRQEIDWEWIDCWSRRAAMERMVCLALKLGEIVFDVPVPRVFETKHQAMKAILPAIPTVVSRLSPELASWVAQRQRASLFLFTLDRRGSRIRRSLRLAFQPTPSDFSKFDLPDWAFLLYYPLRLVRLLTEAVAGRWPNQRKASSKARNDPPMQS